MTNVEKRRQATVIRHWANSAQRDRETAQSLYRSKHLDWSLFVFHLAIEKLLKAHVVAAEHTPPFTHDLVRLAVIAGLALSARYRAWLREISKYNIEARYAEEKRALFRKATPAYTRAWFRRCETIFQWLDKRFL